MLNTVRMYVRLCMCELYLYVIALGRISPTRSKMTNEQIKMI